MSDLIERQAAIEAIAYSIELCNKALDSMTLGGRDRYAVEVERNSLLKLKDDFKLLPFAQPERKRGKWIKLDMHAHLADHKCSVCEQECYVPTCMGEPMYDFCPNCGAKMTEDKT